MSSEACDTCRYTQCSHSLLTWGDDNGIWQCVEMIISHTFVLSLLTVAHDMHDIQERLKADHLLRVQLDVSASTSTTSRDAAAQPSLSHKVRSTSCGHLRHSICQLADLPGCAPKLWCLILYTHQNSSRSVGDLLHAIFYSNLLFGVWVCAGRRR